MRSFVIPRSALDKCPKRSMAPRHYRPDGTCYCNDEGIAEKRRLGTRRRELVEELAQIEERIREVAW